MRVIKCNVSSRIRNRVSLYFKDKQMFVIHNDNCLLESVYDKYGYIMYLKSSYSGVVFDMIDLIENTDTITHKRNNPYWKL